MANRTDRPPQDAMTSKVTIGVVTGLLMLLIGGFIGQFSAVGRDDIKEVVQDAVAPIIGHLEHNSHRLDAHEAQIGEIRETAGSAKERVDMIQRWWTPQKASP